MKRAALCMIVCLVLLCAACGVQKPLERYSHTFFGTFDTFVVLTAYTADKAAFDKAAELCESEFHRYHQLFDPYHHSKTQNNIYNLNEGAWKEPMQVDPDLMELLVRCRDMQKQLPGGVNIAMGRMLRLWHTARDDAEYDPYSAYIPDMDKLRDAAQHSSIDDVVLDEENMTVFFKDDKLRLELGAVAKGYAAQKVAEKVAQLVPHFSLNAGGNIVVGKAPGGEVGHWKAGVQNPDMGLFTDDQRELCTIWLENQALVTSGDYQRYYYVGEERYHHIIDEKTCMPARSVRAVTVLADDSLLADFLSTTAFVLPYEESRKMIESLDNVEALWVLPDGSVAMTNGFESKILETEL